MTVVTDNTHYKAIADAIRSKNGSEDTYTPAQMAEEIKNLALSSVTKYEGTSDITSDTKIVYLLVDGTKDKIPNFDPNKFYIGYAWADDATIEVGRQNAANGSEFFNVAFSFAYHPPRLSVEFQPSYQQRILKVDAEGTITAWVRNSQVQVGSFPVYQAPIGTYHYVIYEVG